MSNVVNDISADFALKILLARDEKYNSERRAQEASGWEDERALEGLREDLDEAICNAIAAGVDVRVYGYDPDDYADR